MNRIKTTLTNAIFWIVLVLSCFLLENIALLTSDQMKGFGNMTFALIAGLIIMFFIVYFFMEHRKNRMGVKWVYLVTLGFMFIYSAIRVALLKDYTFISQDGLSINTFSADGIKKTRYIIETFIGLTMAYILLFCYSKGRASIGKYQWFCWILILTVFIAIAFIFVLDKKFLNSLVHLEKPEGYAMSFFFNPNTFGAAFLIGIFACVVLNLYKQRWYLYAIMIVFWLFNLMTFCSASTLIGGAAIIVFPLISVFARFKAKPVKSAIMFGVFFFVATAIILSLAMFVFFKVPVLSKIIEASIESITKKDYGTLTGRTEIWKGTMKFLLSDPTSFIFGIGPRISKEFMGAYSPSVVPGVVYSTHNGPLQIFLDYGLFGVALYCALLVYVVICFVKVFRRKKKEFAFVYLFLILFYLVYSFAESTYFLRIDTFSTTVTMLILLPLLQAKQNLTKPERIEEFKAIKTDDQPLGHLRIGYLISMVICGLLVAVSSTYLAYRINKIPFYTGKGFLTIAICLLFVLLFVPYMISLWTKKAGKIRFSIRCILQAIAIVGLTACWYPLYKFTPLQRLPLANYWSLPVVFGSVILLDFILSCIYFGGSFKDWFKTFIFGSFVMPFLGFIGSAISFVLTLLVMRLHPSTDLLRFVVLAVISFAFYFVFNIILKTKVLKSIYKYFDNYGIRSMQKHLRKDGI